MAMVQMGSGGDMLSQVKACLEARMARIGGIFCSWRRAFGDRGPERTAGDGGGSAGQKKGRLGWADLSGRPPRWGGSRGRVHTESGRIKKQFWAAIRQAQIV